MVPKASPAKILKWSNYSLDLDSRTSIMGILNVTPDSFFDGGRHFQTNTAIRSGIEMARQGADIIDVGGESTRPFSDPVPLEEELKRVIPVIKALSREIDLPISIDTYKSQVARKAIEAGASMVNDISALRFDPEMGSMVASANLPIVLMHMKGTPRDMQVNPVYKDVVEELMGFMADSIENAVDFGIKRDFVIIDPGIGFGKSLEDNLRILKALQKFSSLDSPILVGTSNKSFIGKLLDFPAELRRNGTLASITACVLNGANIVRVHDVQAAREAVIIADAIKSVDF